MIANNGHFTARHSISLSRSRSGFDHERLHTLASVDVLQVDLPGDNWRASNIWASLSPPSFSDAAYPILR